MNTPLPFICSCLKRIYPCAWRSLRTHPPAGLPASPGVLAHRPPGYDVLLVMTEGYMASSGETIQQIYKVVKSKKFGRPMQTKGRSNVAGWPSESTVKYSFTHEHRWPVSPTSAPRRTYAPDI